MTNGRPTMKDIYDEVQGLRKEISQNYVSKERFKPVEKLVYGAVGLILMMFLTGLVILVSSSNAIAFF